LNRSYRITSTNDFERVRHSGKTYAHPLVVIIVSNGLSGNSRVGIITSKSIGNAVARNKARRRIRSVFKDYLTNFIQPYDIVVIARSAIATASYQEIETAIAELLVRAGLLPK